jgi:SynChlorMet cassette protein ScmC
MSDTPPGLKLDLADGQRWLILPVDDKAALLVAELGRAMRLGPGEGGRELYVAVSSESDLSDWSDLGLGGSVVCCLPEPTTPDMLAVDMGRIASAIARESMARGGLLLHAALAEYRGSGFVMAAPSGVGKSTASSRLRPPWHSLCDDATLVVRGRNGRWWAHPWPTWSRFFQNGPGGSWPVEQAVHLRVLYFISRAADDRIEPVNATQATALTLESAVDLTWGANRLTDEESARTLSSDGVRAARALTSAVPAYALRLSLDGRFWEEVERVLPVAVLPESGENERARRQASVDSLIARDSRRLVYTGASMNPTLVEPELLQVEPYRSQRVTPGDIVCFKSPDGDMTVVHRVVSVERERVEDDSPKEHIRTRGDNNAWNDAWALPASQVIGRVTAAQRGTRKRKVHGGWRGFATLRWERLGQGIRRRAGRVPHKLYGLLAGLGPFDRLLPRSVRPRLVRFDARYRVFLKLLMGGQTVGQYDDRREEWRIRRPFNLFINRQSLPGPKSATPGQQSR